MGFLVKKFLKVAVFTAIYLYAFGGAVFYEKIGSDRLDTILTSLSLEAKHIVAGEAMAKGFNELAAGKKTEWADLLPDYIVDERMIALKVNGGFAGLHFPNEPKIDIPALQNAAILGGFLVGVLIFL